MYECVFCSATDPLSLDHVVPACTQGVRVGLLNDRLNLLTACRQCNSDASRGVELGGKARQDMHERLLLFGRFRGVTVMTFKAYLEGVKAVVFQEAGVAV
jgi:hypothetical protein